MVVGRGVGDAETDRHATEEGRVGDLLFREVRTDVEHDLVHADFQLAEQRHVGAAVGVGPHLLQEAAPIVRGVETEELELEVGGGPAAGWCRGRGWSGGQASAFSSRRCLRSGRMARPSPRRPRSGFSIPNRERSYGMWCLLGRRAVSSLPRGTLRARPSLCGRACSAQRGCNGP